MRVRMLKCCIAARFLDPSDTSRGKTLCICFTSAALMSSLRQHGGLGLSRQRASQRHRCVYISVIPPKRCHKVTCDEFPKTLRSPLQVYTPPLQVYTPLPPLSRTLCAKEVLSPPGLILIGNLGMHE